MSEEKEPIGSISLNLNSDEIMDLILSVTDKILKIRKELENPNTPYGNSQTEKQSSIIQNTVDRYQELVRYNNLYEKLQHLLDEIMDKNRKSSNRDW